MASPKSQPAPSDPQAQRYRALYPFGGLLVALICVGAGVALFLAGATGQADWESTFMMIHLRLNTQAPGIVCFLVAAVIVYLSRPKRT
jgi:hypothetical protein